MNEDDEPPSDEAGSDNENRTRKGAVLGTPAHMSPEQARGGTKDVDARADVFALGTIFCARS